MNAALKLCLAAVLVASCGTSVPTESPALPSIVPGAAATYDGIAWFGDAIVAARAEPEDPGSEFRLVTIDPATGTATQIQIRPTPDCVRQDASSPNVDAGDLVWVDRCELDSAGSRRYTFLRTDDLSAAPEPGLSANGSFVLRSPGVWGDSFIASSGTVVCETLVEVRDDKISPVARDVVGPDGSFVTGVLDPPDCSDHGIAFMPTANADGALAFLASTQAIGKVGTERLRQPFDVYRTDATSTSTSRIAVGLTSPSALEWLPDGGSLIFSGRRTEGPGTWIVNVESGRIMQTLPFSVTSIAISADGTRMAFTIPDGVASSMARIGFADVPVPR